MSAGLTLRDGDQQVIAECDDPSAMLTGGAVFRFTRRGSPWFIYSGDHLFQELPAHMRGWKFTPPDSLQITLDLHATGDPSS